MQPTLQSKSCFIFLIKWVRNYMLFLKILYTFRKNLSWYRSSCSSLLRILTQLCLEGTCSWDWPSVIYRGGSPLEEKFQLGGFTDTKTECHCGNNYSDGTQQAISYLSCGVHQGTFAQILKELGAQSFKFFITVIPDDGGQICDAGAARLIVHTEKTKETSLLSVGASPTALILLGLLFRRTSWAHPGDSVYKGKHKTF